MPELKYQLGVIVSFTVVHLVPKFEVRLEDSFG